MKLDLLSWKWIENIFSNDSIVLFILAFILGYIPMGFYCMLAFLGYLFIKENEEKYIVLIGYFLACISKGVIFTYSQVLMVSIWFAIVFLFHMIIHNPLTYIPFVSVALLVLYDMLLGSTMIINNVLFYLVVFVTLKKLFYKSKEALIFIGITILMLIYLHYVPQFMNEEAMLFLYSLLLVSLTTFMSLSNLIVILFLSILIIGNSPYFICTLLFWTMYKECKLSNFLLYIIYIASIYYFSQNLFYTISGSIFTGVMIYFNKELEKNEIESSKTLYDDSKRLLNQFSKLCRSMVNVGIESSLIQVMAEVFENSAKELEKIEPYEQYPSLIKEVLITYKYEYRNIEIHYEQALFINLQLYNTNKIDIVNTLIPILETVLHTKLYLQEYQKANLLHSYHECTLVAHPCITIKYECFQKANADVCGDAINVLSKNEKKVFFLSDGMGEGYTAKSQSEFAISFLSELFLIGVPFTQMIRIINQFLLLKQKESFATLDIVCIDTLSKQCFLYKAGSAQTYLVRDGSIHLFEAQSLPLGIVSKVTPDIYCVNLKEGDLIVMMSDGAESERMEEWLLPLNGAQPSTIVQEIYSKKVEENIMDDMSLLAIKVQNNFHFH